MSKRPGPKPRYPWKQWLKLHTKHLLKPGQDYTCTTRSFIGYLYKAAIRYGVQARVSETKDGFVELRVERRIPRAKAT